VKADLIFILIFFGVDFQVAGVPNQDAGKTIAFGVAGPLTRTSSSCNRGDPGDVSMNRQDLITQMSECRAQIERERGAARGFLL